MTTSQLEKVRTYLKAGRTLTSAEARSRFGIKNLSARIFDLRRDGLTINTTPYTRKNGANAVKYALQTQPVKRTRSRRAST